MKTVIRILLFVAVVVVACLAYLLLWPVPIDPIAWEPAPDPGLTGPFEVNTALAAMERMGDDPELIGPEDVALDSDGNVYGGLEDGRIMKWSPDFETVEEIADTEGRPLGLDFDKDGNLIIADAIKGLLSLAPDGAITTLSTTEGGVPFRFTDDLDIAPDGVIYFTDASFKFTAGQSKPDIVENRLNGRLLAYDPKSKEASLVMADLQFPNGVAISPDGSFLLMNETGRYRIHKVWLTDDRKYESELVVESLPGFPDNITSNGKGQYWVAIFAPRNKLLDDYAGNPMMRKMMMRLPAFVQPAPLRYSMCLGIDGDGNILHNLQDPGGIYAPVTSVVEHGDHLYFGSLEDTAVGKLPLP